MLIKNGDCEILNVLKDGDDQETKVALESVKHNISKDSNILESTVEVDVQDIDSSIAKK